VRRSHIQAELFDQPRQAGRLAHREVEHETRERGGVDDRMLEGALEPAAHEPRVERVVAVLHQHRAVGEAQEGPPGVAEVRRADEHRPIDVVPPLGVRVDRCPAIDEGVEEGERPVEAKALGAELQDQEGRVACGLDVEGDELSVFETGLGPDLRGVDGDLLPWHRLRRAARLEKEGLGAHQRAWASARRAQLISSLLRARRSNTAAP
jgi:hypothetical protein